MGFPSKLFLLEDKQFQLTQPSLMGQICSPLMISMILHWTHCQHVHACLVLGSPALDTALGCAGQNGRTTSLHLLAALPHAAWDLLAASAAEACYAVGSCSARCLSVRLLSPPGMSWDWGWLLPWCRALHFVLLNFMRFPSVHFSSLSSCL